MNNNDMVLMYASIILMVMTAGAAAQTNSFAPHDTTPAIVHLEQYTSGEREVSQTDPIVRPVGWSPDGKFAWIVQELDRPRARELRSTFAFIIVDTVTDEIVFVLEDGGFSVPAGQRQLDPAQAWEIAWERNNAAFTGELETHGVVIGAGTELLGFPLEDAVRSYDAATSTTSSISQLGEQGIVSYAITMIRNGGEYKTISAASVLHDLDVWIAGCFRSPYQNRVAVVYGREHRTAEGERRVEFSLTGSHLDVGFSWKTWPSFRAAAAWSSLTPRDVAAIVAAGADVNRLHLDEHLSPLMQAASHNEDPAVIQALIDAGADVNAGDLLFNRRVIMYASANNANPAVIETLLAAGADPNLWGSLSSPANALDAATRNANWAVMAPLLRAGVEVNHGAPSSGYSSLMNAARLAHDPRPIELLLDFGADITARDEIGQTAWDHAQQNPALQGSYILDRLAIE